MAATVSSCSNAILAANSILQIVRSITKIFTSTCARDFCEKIMPLIQSTKLEQNGQNFLNLSFQLKQTFRLPASI